ncbi:serine/Arginine-related protein 53-like [Trichoplusia ni]|uniref:Serine/Arginine-related protein 53-like n=1 Tax=Trichoplusia ni TaxID=7111 RepID=A0A7E5VEN7_TRINI|nr:serine/Arginine-related protein 53-like [Trichoplusia ni]
MPRERSRYRDRRSTSYSSESSYERRRSKSKHKRRSRSRDRSESSSHKRRRSSSRTRSRRRSYTRSLSRDRYESRSKRRSTSRSRSKRDRSRSLSSSRSKNKYKQKKSKKRSSSSRSGSFDIERPTHTKSLDDTETKLEKAIKAAEAVGLTMTKIPTYEYKEVEIKEDMPTILDRNLLAELNSESFVQRTFTSSRAKKQPQNIVIDLDSQTVKIPESDVKPPADDSIINFDEIPSEEELREMWIQKLYHYRKKMLGGGEL